jgi:formyltetrahydrofolate deformylase
MIGEKMNTAVLLLSTPMGLARKGVVAEITRFLIAHKGSVLHSDDHLDSSRGQFLSRLEWDLAEFDMPVPASAIIPTPNGSPTFIPPVD